jgi:hypothetical protein
MKLKQIEWKTATGYSTAKNAYIGKIKVGGWYYSGMRPAGDPLKYAATCRLTGIKEDLGHFETREEAQKRVEIAVETFIRLLTEE